MFYEYIFLDSQVVQAGMIQNGGKYITLHLAKRKMSMCVIIKCGSW